MEKQFLDICAYLSPEGYYARNKKEIQIFKALEKENKVKRKQGTKSTYVIATYPLSDNIPTIKEFLKELRISFATLRSSYRPFVLIKDVKTNLQHKLHISDSKFDTYILNLYKDGIIDLEQSLSNNESKGNFGIIANSGKIFSYILDVN